MNLSLGTWAPKLCSLTYVVMALRQRFSRGHLPARLHLP